MTIKDFENKPGSLQKSNANKYKKKGTRQRASREKAETRINTTNKKIKTNTANEIQ